MKHIIVIICTFILLAKGWAQTDSFSAEPFIRQECSAASKLKNPGMVLRFYECTQFRKAWVINPTLQRELETLLMRAAEYGLNDQYYYKGLNHIKQFADTEPDSFRADLLFTDLCFSFTNNVRYGNGTAMVGYSGLSCEYGKDEIPVLLAAAVESGSIRHFVDSIENRTPGCRSFKKEIAGHLKQQGPRHADTLQVLFRAINELRMVYCLLGTYPKLVLVNIPSATLEVHGQDSILLLSDVIVGKPSTHTPTLISEIKEIMLYPYWHVPHSIASRELLPAIKKNPGYLQKNNFQVLNRSGRIVDPASINWHALNASNFPYTLRQSTGCDNSLGLIKFNFQSPYSVYLHDTPWKLLFGFPKRFFSHGCIRVEKARELARLLLDENAIAIDTLITDSPPPVHNPVPVRLAEPVPILVLYNTAWPDSSGIVQYYRDIYRKEGKQKPDKY